MSNIGPESELKIAHILGIMRQRWFGKKNREECAALWGVTPEWVTDLASIARKRRLAEVTDHENIKAMGGDALERIISDAMESDDPRDRANAIKAVDVWTNVMGASAPQKIDANITTVDDDGLARKLAGLVAAGAKGEDPGEPDAGGTPEG